MLVNIAFIRAYDMARVCEVLSALELHIRDHMDGYSMTRKCNTFDNIHIFHIILIFFNFYFK